MRYLFGILIIVAVTAQFRSAHAQTALGSITGILKDTSGAVVPGAGVTARNQSTGVEARTTTSGTGNFVILNLQVGIYDLTASAAGFKTWSRTEISLSSGDNLRVDPVLEVGSINEQIRVTAESPALKTESADVSTVMSPELCALAGARLRAGA